MKTEKGFAWVPILIIFLCAVLIGLGSWYYIYKIYLPKISEIAPMEVKRPTAGKEKKEEEATKLTEEVPQKPITWTVPEEIPSLKLFWLKIRPKGGRYYKVGTINEGKYAGGEIILAFAEVPSFQMPACTDDLYRFIRKDNKLYLLTRYSTKLYEGDGLDRSMFTKDSSFTIPELDFPSTIIYKQAKLILETAEFNLLFPSTGLREVFKDSKVGSVYTTYPSNVKEAWYDKFKNCFFVKAPDGTAKIYKLSPDFIDEKGVPAVVWNDGQKNSDPYVYVYRPPEVCISECPITVDLSENEIKSTGKTKNGQLVYEYKDQNHKDLKKLYEEEYIVGEGETKVSYDQFIATHPIFFWKDPFGRFIMFINENYTPPVEIAKPVIYLYPKTVSLVSVKVNPSGGICKSEPVYQNGWQVIAYPGGRLFDLGSFKFYSSLFWEGKSEDYQMPKEGFVVEREEISNFLAQKLKVLGLNERETSEFLEFWQPKILQHQAPYYLITFLPKPEIDRISPLLINPQPDTVIRILIDFKPLKQYVEIPQPQIVTPERKGFTVVEWGGVLH